jgi:hypothetical protein
MQQKTRAVEPNPTALALLEVIMRNIPAAKTVAEVQDFTIRNEALRKAA